MLSSRMMPVLLTMVCLAVPMAGAELSVALDFRNITTEWESDYIGASSGSSNTSNGLDHWADALGENVASMDKLLTLDAYVTQDSLATTELFSGSNTSSASMLVNGALGGTSIGSNTSGTSIFAIRFGVTAETQVQFSADNYALSASEYGQAVFAVEILDFATGDTLYSFVDVASNSETSGSTMSEYLTLQPGTPYHMTVENYAEIAMDTVPAMPKYESAASSSTYGLTIVPEPCSLLMLLLSIPLAARRR